jgi:hypothetical protein
VDEEGGGGDHDEQEEKHVYMITGTRFQEFSQN